MKIKDHNFIIVLVTSFQILFGFETALADHIDSEVQTQVNKRTDLFERSINDLPAVEKQLEDSKHEAVKSLGDGSNLPQGLSSIIKKSKGELEAASDKLSSIREHDLNTRGREEMLKNNVINELYPDYTRPLNKQYMEDAKVIAAGSHKLLDNLLDKLKELGVDCKTIKGNRRVDPEYFLKVKTTEHKDTIYNQTICEELRNKYFCNDKLTMKCINKSSGELRPENIRLSYSEMPKSWWGALYGTTPVFGIFTQSRGINDFLGSDKFKQYGSDNVKNEVVQLIKQKTGAEFVELPDQRIVIRMGQEIIYELNEQGDKGTWQGGFHYPVEADGTIRFFYRAAREEKCTSWSEEWNEECRLQ